MKAQIRNEENAHMKFRTMTLAVALALAATSAFAAKADAQTVSLTLTPLLVAPLTVAAVQPKPIGSVKTCPHPNRAAAVDGPTFADYPMIAQQQQVEGTTMLRVDIGTNGALAHEAVLDSSGDALLDNEAMRTARISSFSPELRDCQAVAGAYMLTVAFSNA
jgi:TonB family protein